MFQVETDPSKNLLAIRFSQKVGLEDARHCALRVESLLPDLQPGFRLLTDLTELEWMDVACAPYLERAMDLCDRRGVAKVVRIVPDPSKDIGLSIMSLFHYRHPVPIVTCETMAEAMNELAV